MLARADGFFRAGQYDKAEIEYKNVIQAHGLDPLAVSRIGIIYFEQGRLGPAFQYLFKGSELQPDNPEPRVKLGLYYFAIGRGDEARAAAALALDKDPKRDDAIMLLAEASLKAKDMAAARARLSALPLQNAAVLSALALLDVRENKIKEAEGLLGRALELDLKFGPANSILGALYLSRKDTARAEQAFAVAAESASPRSALKIQYAQFNLQVGQVAAAKRSLEETIRNAPDFIPARMMLAGIFANEKNYDEAIAGLDKVLGQDGAHPEALLLSAQMRLAKGEKEKAILTLETVTRLFPRAAQAHHQLGAAHSANGETGKAAASFAQAVALEPRFAAPALALAEINIRQGNIGPAITSLRQLLVQNPGLVEAQTLLATAYRVQGNLADSIAALRQLVVMAPKSPAAHLNLGMSLLQQGKTEEGRNSLTTAAELAPDDFSVLEQLVSLDIFEKKSAAALTRVSDQIARTPAQGRLQILLSRVHSSRSDFTSAEIALRKATELQPASLDSYFALVQLLVSTNQQDKAVSELRQVILRNPKDIRPLMILAGLHEQKKDFAAARQDYEQILAIDPKVGVALNNLAYIYSDHVNDQDKALDLAQRARDLMPNQWETADTLGWVLYKKRQFQRAIPLLEEACTKNPENPELRFHLGMAYYMAGDEPKSRSALEQALRLNQKFPGADEAALSLALLNIDAGKSGPADLAKLEDVASKRKDDAVVLSRLGELYERSGNRDKAMSAYESALNASPAHIGATVGMIRLVHAKGETPRAYELAKAARKLAPKDSRLAHTFGRLAYETGDFLTAATALQDAARQLPDDTVIRYDLAEAAYSVGRLAETQAALREALEKSPESSRAGKAREFLAMMALSANASDAAGAAVKIETALAANASDVPALMAKGIIAEEKRDLDAAKKLYERALAVFPDFSPAKKRLAILYAAKADDDRKGLEFATKAREAFPDDAELARALGIITFRLGNYPRAATLLLESARTRSTDAELFYYLGLAQQKQKDTAAGTRSLQKALELGLPENLAAEVKKALAPAK